MLSVVLMGVLMLMGVLDAIVVWIQGLVVFGRWELLGMMDCGG